METIPLTARSGQNVIQQFWKNDIFYDIANETLADEEFAEIIAKNHLEPREYKTGFTRITDKAAL